MPRNGKEDTELLDPLNARGGPLKLYSVATSYISICWDMVDPNCAEKRTQLSRKGTLSKQDKSEI
jgi:hypothetical protein